MTASHRPRARLRTLVCAGAALLAIGMAAIGAATVAPSEAAARPSMLPEFKHGGADAWINSAPLTKAGLRGKVVLVEVYTSGWINCQRSFPWVHGMEQEYKGTDFVVVKIHSPEFGWEKDRDTVVKYAKRFNLTSPIYLDNDFAFWNALENRYWPAFYLVDKKGNIRRHSVGEMHMGEDTAEGFRHEINWLLKEPG